MKLLIVTQVVDTENTALSFFHQWLIEFAKQVDSLTVICLYEGKHTFPDNVEVYSLGKENGIRSTFSYALSFLKLAYTLRNTYDNVFVHMNPEYVIIAGPMWKALGKKVGLWYMHKSVSWRLRLGVYFSDVVFTASSKSIRIDTNKKCVVGHGISLEGMKNEERSAPYPPLHLLSIGRISRIKRIDILIDAIALLKDNDIFAQLQLVGGAVTEDGHLYQQELEKRITQLRIEDRVRFSGSIAHEEIGAFFADTHLFLHASDTGSLDKASLEPLVWGVPIITTDAELASTAVTGIIFAEPSAESFAKAIQKTITVRLWQDEGVRRGLQQFVTETHDLTQLVPKILTQLT